MKQEDIIKKIAIEQGLKIGQAREIWYLFGKFIKDTMMSVDKEGIIDIEDCPTIHVARFGKFVPVEWRITKHNNETRFRQTEEYERIRRKKREKGSSTD